MKILSYLPCDGWYFVYDNGRERVLTRLALWAVVSNGEAGGDTETTRVVGMVSIRRHPSSDHGLALEPVPEGVEGCYVHERDLSSDELAVLEKYRRSQ